MRTLKKVLIFLLSITSVAFAGCELLEPVEGDSGNVITSQESIVADGNSNASEEDGPLDEEDGALEQEEIIETFSYREENGELTVVGIVGGTDGILVIPDEYDGKPVVHIADGTFGYGEILTSVTIGDNVQTIGEGAFAASVNLENVIFGGNVHTIGKLAFAECSQLTSVVLGEKVETIGVGAFAYCDNLTSIFLPNGLREIGERAFLFCGALTIYCQAESKPDAWGEEWNSFGVPYSYNPCPVVWDCDNNDVADDGFVYSVVEGVRYALKDQKAIVARQATRIKNAVIRSSVEYKGVTYPVEEIPAKSFWGTAVENVVIPDSVVTIGLQAFYQCSKLTSVKIPVNVLYIGANAFSGNDLIIYCEVESKPSGWVADWTTSAVVWNYKNNDTAEDGYVYAKIDGLRYALKDGKAKLIRQENDIVEARIVFLIEYRGVQYHLTEFDPDAFRGCNNLVNIQFPEAAINQEDYHYEIIDSMFRGCSSLESITIPNGLTSIGKYAFQGCRSLTSINLPNGLTSIGEYAFQDCSSLTSVNLPNGTTSIGAYAFKDCTSLININIPDSVVDIGEAAFQNCSSLMSVSIPEGVVDIAYSTFENCANLTNVDISNGVVNIGESAFNGCERLDEILLPDNVECIGFAAFENTGYYNNQENWEDDVLYIGKYLIRAQTLISGECLVKAGTMMIADYAFAYCRELESVVLPSGVKYIGYSAFNGCFYLGTVSLPDGIERIGGFAFAGTWLRNVNFPDSITTIGEGAFYNSGLQSFVLPNGVTVINMNSFANCGNLSEVTLHNRLTEIGASAFPYCRALTSIEIPSSVTSVGEKAFEGCVALTIYCEEESKPSGWDAEWNFIGNSMPPKLYCPVVWDCDNNDVADDGNVYVISNGVRYALKDGRATVVRQSENICEAWISKSIMYNGAEYVVTRIESAAFTNCEIVGFVVIPDSVIEIEAYAFRFSGTFILEYLPVKIFCESEDQPSGWEENWYDSQHVIYWQMKDWHYVNGEIVILS